MAERRINQEKSYSIVTSASSTPPESSASVPQADNVGNNQWVCTFCGMANDDALISCKRCFTERSIEDVRRCRFSFPPIPLLPRTALHPIFRGSHLTLSWSMQEWTAWLYQERREQIHGNSWPEARYHLHWRCPRELRGAKTAIYQLRRRGHVYTRKGSVWKSACRISRRLCRPRAGFLRSDPILNWFAESLSTAKTHFLDGYHTSYFLKKLYCFMHFLFLLVLSSSSSSYNYLWTK